MLRILSMITQKAPPTAVMDKNQKLTIITRSLVKSLIREYDKNKGTRISSWESKNVTRLKKVIEALPETKDNNFSINEIFQLCQIVLESKGGAGSAAQQLFSNIETGLGGITDYTPVSSSSPLSITKWLKKQPIISLENFIKLYNCSNSDSAAQSFSMLPALNRNQHNFDMLLQVSNFEGIDGIFGILPSELHNQTTYELIYQHAKNADDIYTFMWFLPDDMRSQHNFEALVKCHNIPLVASAVMFIQHFSSNYARIEMEDLQILSSLNQQKLECLFMHAPPASAENKLMIKNIFGHISPKLHTISNLKSVMNSNFSCQEQITIGKVFGLLPIKLHIQRNFILLCDYVKYDRDDRMFNKLVDLKRQRILTQENFDKVISAFVSDQMTAFCMGTHPRLGADSFVHRFFGHPTEAKANLDPMANIADPMVLSEMRKFLM